MAAGPQYTAGSGLRRIQAYLLGTDGVPTGDESGATGYDGIEVEAARSFALTVPDVRRIQHIGNDRVLAQDFLPPTEGVSGEITTAIQNLALDAALTDTLVETHGEATASGMATDKQGSEVDVCVIAYRQALNMTSGAAQSRRWQMHVIPIGRIIPRGSTAGQDAADENRYTVVPSVATQYPWGEAFSAAAGEEGFTEAQYLRFTAENPVVLNRWTGNATITEFTANWTPISVAKTYVAVNGVSATVASVTAGTKKITMQSAPANDATVVAWYETSDSIG